MRTFANAMVAGAAGALTTNLLHEIVRRTRSDAPRIDLLGMQAVAKGCAAVGLPVPRGRVLYGVTFSADLLANTVYFAFVGAAPRDRSLTAGLSLGILAGIGAVVLPQKLGLSAKPANRTTMTRVTSVALYASGGLAAALVRRKPAENAHDDGHFAAKHVVVTGGSRGLGFVLARQLLALGARVTICGRTQASLESAAATIDSESLAAIVCDVRKPEDCRRLIDEAIARHGPVDILINNAGVIEVGPLSTQRIEDYREAMDTHFWGPLQMTLAVLPAMRARGRGHVVNVASVGGLIAVPHLAPYCASKFAQIGLTQGLASELAVDGIAVTSIVPGLMITGSPERAVFKGRNRAEFAWFTLSDANPLISVGAETAARRILAAVARGRAQAVIGSSAKIAQIVNASAPETTARLLQFAARLLPGADASESGRHVGAQSHSAWTRNPLTWLNSAAAKKNNQATPSTPRVPPNA